MDFLGIIRSIGIAGFVDILIMSVMIYAVLILVKKTRAGFVVIGMFMIGGLYLISEIAHLQLTKSVLQVFSTVILIGLIVIFQEEIKQFFERLANPRLVSTLVSLRRGGDEPVEIDILTRTLMDLARRKIGALVVLKGRDSIVRFLDGGVDLDGRISEPLIRSIFDPHSLGHDGAVLIEGTLIRQFGVHLPLSKNLGQLRYVGTRHAAALGISERSDALCLAVSEERGTVSAARRGRLEVIEGPEALRALLSDFRREMAPAEAPRLWKDLIRKNWREKLFAIVATLVLWYLLVFKAKGGDS